MSALLRAVRQQRGLTLEELAVAAGLTKSYLSKIERQRATPSIAVAMRVAEILDVDVAQLFAPAQAATTLSVDRKDTRPAGHWTAVSTDMLGKAMSPFVVRPTKDFVEHPHSVHVGQEFMFVHSGSVELRYGERSVTLHAGDSTYFDSSVAHRLRRLGDESCEVIVVTYSAPSRKR